MYLLIGCNNSREWVHPINEKFIVLDSISVSIDIQKVEQQSLIQNQLKSKVYIATIGDSIKNLYTRSRVKFDIDNQNTIYISNPNTNSVDLYSIEGEKLGSIGRRGYGPGELLRLKTFDFSSDFKTIYLLGELEIEVFEYINSEYKHVTTIEHGFLRVYDMCVLDDEIYVSGYAINKNVQGNIAPGFGLFIGK